MKNAVVLHRGASNEYHNLSFVEQNEKYQELLLEKKKRLVWSYGPN